MIKVHESVVLSRDVRIRRLSTAKLSPRLELFVQPIFLGSTKWIGVEHVKDS